MKYDFGTKGIWKKRIDGKLKNIPVRVLDHNIESGVMYVYTDPLYKGLDSLTYRTATIFARDFKPDTFKTKLGLWKGKEIESLPREDLYDLILHLSKNQKEIGNGEWCPTCGADLPPNHRLKK